MCSIPNLINLPGGNFFNWGRARSTFCVISVHGIIYLQLGQEERAIRRLNIFGRMNILPLTHDAMWFPLWMNIPPTWWNNHPKASRLTEKVKFTLQKCWNKICPSQTSRNIDLLICNNNSCWKKTLLRRLAFGRNFSAQISLCLQQAHFANKSDRSTTGGL